VSVAVVALMAASIPILGEFYARSLERYGAPPDVIGEVLSDQPDPQVIAQLQPRVALLVASIAIARDEFPLGGGIGRFGSHMSRVSYSPLYAEYGLDRTHGLRESNPRAVTDTFWPMILGEAGVLGLVGAALFVGGLGMRLWRAAARDASPEVRAFILGGLLVFGEGVVRSLVSPALVAPPVAHFVFGAAALALGLDGRARQVEAEQVK
jgi:hypothetical protein